MSEGPLVLLVDDFEDAVDIYREYLTYRGYRVVVARNGREALAVARARTPDVILLDLSMPVLSGLEAMRILRSEQAFDACPIVALTAHALDGERIAALRAGFDEVIAKPCLPDALADAVARILSARRVAPSALDATGRPHPIDEALLRPTTCPDCASTKVRPGVRVAAVRYYWCGECRLCWRVEAASAL